MRTLMLSVSIGIASSVCSVPAAFASPPVWCAAAPTCDPTLIADRLPASGSGTMADPYVITTCCQLQGIRDSNGKYYVLDNDIDCTATPSWNAGAGFIPIGGNGGLIYVNGGLDGQDYDIVGLYMADVLYTGLFARASGVTIENLGLSYADINGSLLVGGVVANAYGGTSLTNVSVVNSSVSGSSSTVGGLIGSAGAGVTITDSSYQGDVSGTATVGGLVGSATNTAGITNCYANATVTATSNAVGGLVGNFGGTISPASITDSCAEGSVTSNITHQVGGLVGYLATGGTIVGSGWDNNQAACAGLALGTVTSCVTPCPCPP